MKVGQRDKNIFRGLGGLVFLTGFFLGGVSSPFLYGASGEKILTFSLQTLIQKTLDEGGESLELEAGRFFIDTEIISISNVRRFTLSGKPGKTVLVSHALRPIFFVESSQNIVLKNLIVDYDPLPFTQGVITGIDPVKRELSYTIDAGYPELNGPFATTTVFFFDGKTRRWKRNVTDGYYRENQAASSTNGRLLGAQGIFSNENFLQRGDLVVFPVRRSSAILFTSCENVRVESVEIFSAPGDAILCRYMKGDNYFRFTVRPGPRPLKTYTDRLLSATASGLRYSLAQFGPTVEGCDLSFCGDSGLNVMTPAFPVTAVDGVGHFWIGFPWGNWNALEPLLGDKEALLHLSYGDFSPVQTFLLDECESDPFGQKAANGYINNLYKIGNKASYCRVKPFLENGAAYRRPSLGDLMVFPKLSSDGMVVKRSKFRHLRGHGIRLGTSGALIEDNEFQGLRFSAISMGPDFVPWAEAGWVHDILIRRNLIADTGFDPSMTHRDAKAPGAIALQATVAKTGESGSAPLPPSFHSNIFIEGNEIHLSRASSVWLDGVRNAVVQSNVILRNGLRVRAESGASQGVWADEAVNVIRGEAVRIETGD